MALNPLRETLGSLGSRNTDVKQGFQRVADDALASFRALRSDLERRVLRGEITMKVARETAARQAREVRAELERQSRVMSPVSRSFQERLEEAMSRRKVSQEQKTIEALQRETNQLLRQSLVEQQIQARRVEFEGVTYQRPMVGGVPAPTVDSLLGLYESAELARDEAALEWSRRQLEGLRNRLMNDEDRRRVDLACRRADRVNPRFVADRVQELSKASADEIEVFVTHALAERDASDCVAAFILARQTPDAETTPWVHRVLDGLDAFADSALGLLRTWEADARATEQQATESQAAFAIRIVETESTLASFKPPSESEIVRQAAIDALPVVQPGESVGLNLKRRGLSADEFARLEATTESVDENPEGVTPI